MLVVADDILTHVGSYQDVLLHYGVKGMKWGVRRNSTDRKTRKFNRVKKRSTKLKTKTGETIYLEKGSRLRDKVFVFAEGNPYQNYARAWDSKGNRVGEIGYSRGRINRKYGRVDWNGVNKEYRGKNISQTMMKEVESRLSKKGVKKIRLESVSSPDAKHIYTKMGYKDSRPTDLHSLAGKVAGLQPMTKEISKSKKVQHMYIISDDTLMHVDSTSDILLHYGVKGMKWGVRRNGKPLLSDRAKRNLKIAGGVAAGAALAYGAYRLHKSGHLSGDNAKKLAKSAMNKLGNRPTKPKRSKKGLNKLQKAMTKAGSENAKLVRYNARKQAETWAAQMLTKGQQKPSGKRRPAPSLAQVVKNNERLRSQVDRQIASINKYDYNARRGI